MDKKKKKKEHIWQVRLYFTLAINNNAITRE